MMHLWLRSGGAALAGVLATVGTAAAEQPVPWQLGLQTAASPIMERVTSFHDLLVWIIVGISLFVLGLIGYACWKFRESANPEPSRRSHNTVLEIAWTAVPVLILVIIAVPSFKLLYYSDVLPETEMTVKATGNQWYWSYTYPDHNNFEFVANLVAEEDLQPGQPRLLQTDNEVVIPAATNIRLLVTAADVLHAWAMPSFGIKVDAVPGRLNEAWMRADQPGVYYGQCSEICGVQHAFMPITVRVVPKEEFQTWVTQAQARFGGDAPVELAAGTISTPSAE